MTRILALLFLALMLPTAAPAQTEGESRIETLFGETRGESPIPEIAWKERFQGLHAVDGACGEANAVWAFATDTVEMGRTICTALGKMTWEDGWLIVPAAQCSRMGADVPSRRIWLRAEDGAVTARLEGAETPVRLEPCPPPGG